MNAHPGYEVKTVRENGLARTHDQNLQFQNRTGQHPLGILVLITQFNHVAAYRPQFAEIRDLARQTKPGEVNSVQSR